MAKCLYQSKILFHGNRIDNEQLEEIPLGITKEEIYIKMLEDERTGILAESLFEKLKRIFRKQKQLPPYDEVKGKISDSGQRASWELTEEQKEAALKPVNPNEKTPSVRKTSDMQL